MDRLELEGMSDAAVRDLVPSVWRDDLLANVERRRSGPIASTSFRVGSRSRLTPSDAARFTGDDDFHLVARAVCEAHVLPRKELFETWEAALVITRAHAHRLRGPRARVMDLAGGHGLLALAILVLNPECPSAVVVDKRKPDSHERLCDVFVRQWPRLRGRVRFVEASVEQATPSPDTLLVSVHACGGLTDLILELAVGGGAPVAVVPCCHRALARPRELAARLRDADERGTAYEAPFALDVARFAALKREGFDVDAAILPREITPQNRVLLGAPAESDAEATRADETGEAAGVGWEALAVSLPDSPWRRYAQRA